MSLNPENSPRAREFPISTQNMTLDRRRKQEIRDFHNFSFCQVAAVGDTAARQGEHWKVNF